VNYNNKKKEILTLGALISLFSWKKRLLCNPP